MLVFGQASANCAASCLVADGGACLATGPLCGVAALDAPAAVSVAAAAFGLDRSDSTQDGFVVAARAPTGEIFLVRAARTAAQSLVFGEPTMTGLRSTCAVALAAHDDLLVLVFATVGGNAAFRVFPADDLSAARGVSHTLLSTQSTVESVHVAARAARADGSVAAFATFRMGQRLLAAAIDPVLLTAGRAILVADNALAGAVVPSRLAAVYSVFSLSADGAVDVVAFDLVEGMQRHLGSISATAAAATDACADAAEAAIGAAAFANEQMLVTAGWWRDMSCNLVVAYTLDDISAASTPEWTVSRPDIVADPGGTTYVGLGVDDLSLCLAHVPGSGVRPVAVCAHPPGDDANRIRPSGHMHVDTVVVVAACAAAVGLLVIIVGLVWWRRSRTATPSSRDLPSLVARRDLYAVVGAG